MTSQGDPNPENVPLGREAHVLGTREGGGDSIQVEPPGLFQGFLTGESKGKGRGAGVSEC